MSIGELFSSSRRKEELLKQVQEQDSVMTKVEQRKLSGNERLLNQLQEKDRQELIKKELESRNKREANDYWHKDVIKQKNLFNQSNGNSLLKSGNLFSVGSS